MTDKISI